MTVEIEQQRTKESAGGPIPRPSAHLATGWQKLGMTIWLVVVLIVLLCFGATIVNDVEDLLTRENRVGWSKPAGVALRPGPPVFRYDAERRQLAHIGAIDARRKAELVALLAVDAAGARPEATAGYWEAIDELTYQSNRGLTGLLVRLLLLGGLSGALGTHLRSLTAFIGNACFKNKLDLVVWWPYYVVRPFIGFIIGLVLVAIVQGGFFVVGRDSPAGTFTWIAVALLAGFGDDEFTQKLRQLTKALFGEVQSRTTTDTKVKVGEGDDDAAAKVKVTPGIDAGTSVEVEKPGDGKKQT
ncbi:MAG TPA: hypothetical protein VE974_04655 [Thermoanaerobaculia bacterium]|nr:hypothetical protein [Thermoanaerobaculia bacterium]